jgi:hypothetical protein
MKRKVQVKYHIYVSFTFMKMIIILFYNLIGINNFLLVY